MDDPNRRDCKCDKCIEKTKLILIPKLCEINVCLKSLTELNLSSSNIIEIPEVIGNLVCIIKLDLSSNKLVTLPLSFTKFQHLKDLILSHNKFKLVPKCLIDGMPSITTLDLSQNLLSDINIKPCCVQRLITLNISNNSHIDSLPQWLWSIECDSLESLDVSFTMCLENIQADPYQNMYGIGKHLKNLNATNTNSDVRKLHFVKHLKNLRTLVLNNETCIRSIKNRNYFSNVPLVFNYRFKCVTSLSMSDVDLSVIGKHVYFSLPNLRFLNLSNNVIVLLPDSLSELINLEVCDLSYNQILAIPECFKCLKNLKKLILNNNWISTFPKILDDLSSLQFLDLYANKFVICPSLDLNSNIKSLDLEQNFFSTESNINFNNKENYSKLLKNLRLSINETRNTGPVYIEESNDFNSFDESTGSSSCWSVNSTSEYDEKCPDEINNQDDVNFKLEEFWEGNSYEQTTDIFDPKEFELNLMDELLKLEKPPTSAEKTREKYAVHLANEHYFCPSDELPKKL